MDADLDARLRTQAFAYLNQLDLAGAGLVTREQLEAFTFEGERVPLIARQRGIHKIARLPAALSILTTYSPRPELRPYDDEVGPDGYLRYKWRGTDPDSIVAGIAVHEQDAWYLQRRLAAVLENRIPKNLDPLDFELHASEIKSPYGRGRKPSPWEAIGYANRMATLDMAYRSLATYVPQDPKYPMAYFGAVVDAAYADKTERAYEEVLHKFDEMLTRFGHEQEAPHQRGLALHDEAVVEGDLQTWTARWRRTAGRIGVLTHMADVPVFADSKASRLIQAADLVSWALWRYYGLATPDDYWVRRLWPDFDHDLGVMHGLIHVTREFPTGRCTCPPCASRRPASLEVASTNDGSEHDIPTV